MILVASKIKSTYYKVTNKQALRLDFQLNNASDFNSYPNFLIPIY